MRPVAPSRMGPAGNYTPPGYSGVCGGAHLRPGRQAADPQADLQERLDDSRRRHGGGRGAPWEPPARGAREIRLEVGRGRLAAMDFRRPRPDRPGGIRYLFDCGQVRDQALDGLVLQPKEISPYRLAPLAEALALLRGSIRRRVRAATRQPGNGLPRGRPPRPRSGQDQADPARWEAVWPLIAPSWPVTGPGRS